MKKKDFIIGLLVILPSVIAIAIFVYGFIFWTVRVSTSNWNSFSALLRGEYKFVGFRNYVRLFQDDRFITDLWNTAFFTLFFLVGSIAIGLLTAVLIDSTLINSSVISLLF
jgi:glucose/mannose transport system permease protein